MKEVKYDAKLKAIDCMCPRIRADGDPIPCGNWCPFFEFVPESEEFGNSIHLTCTGSPVVLQVEGEK